MQTVLKIDLNQSSFKKSKTQVQSQTVKAKRLNRAKHLLEKLKDGRQSPGLWTDRKLFTVQAIHHHQHDRIYAVNKEDIPLNERIAHKRQNPASVMVWAGVTSTGEKTPLIFIEEGAKIKQHVYLNMLNEQLVPWINTTFKESGITFLQDGATSHSDNLGQE